MKTIITLLATIACFGCSPSQTDVFVEVLENPSPPEDLDTVQWFSMPKDSALYSVPSAPEDYSEAEAKQYLFGHKTGWEDAGDDIILGIIPGQVDVFSMLVPGSIAFSKETEAHKQGLADGRKHAKRDFKAFRQQIEEKAKTQSAGKHRH